MKKIRTTIFNIAIVGSGGVIGQVATVVTLPILTRIYLPNAYSGWALLMSVVIVFSALSTLRYELAIVLPNTHEEAAYVFLGCIAVTCISAILISIFIPFCGLWLISESFYNDLRSWLWSIPLLILATGLFQTLIAWCTRTQEFIWYSLSTALVPIMTVFSQMLAGLYVNTASGLIIGTFLGQSMTSLVLFILINKKYGRLLLSSVMPKAIIKSLIKYKAYPLYMTPYSLIGTLRDRIVYFLLTPFGKFDLGYYNLSSRLVNMPNSLASSAVRPVFFQHAASTDFRLLEQPVNKALRAIAVAVVPFWILFIFHAEELFAFVFGEPWRDAGLYAVILSVPAIPLLLGNWLDRGFDALGQQKLVFTLELVFSVIIIGALIFGLRFFETAIMGIIFQAGALTFYYSAWLFMLYRIAKFDIRNLIVLSCIIIGVSLVSVLLVWLIRESFSLMQSFLISFGIIASCIAYYVTKQLRYIKIGQI